MDGHDENADLDSGPDTPPECDFDARAIQRPCEELLTYYTIVSACTLVLFPIVFIPHYFKYHTLRYHFDDEGVSMSWGILFKRETYLTYRRIQDIHVTRNIIQRWLGLATVGIQTASGSSGMEMSIEGIKNPEGLRDYLYMQMRGARGERTSVPATGTETVSPETGPDVVTEILIEIRDEVKRLAGAPHGRSDSVHDPADSNAHTDERGGVES
ncbi:MAG: PH domain-containing protein [Planctomycetes bacterium]|nr:PH domain-containing protein [Planctomycetota bacterium]NOG54963.1 PH domain-containing protein [Planctomycetota bacterium]